MDSEVAIITKLAHIYTNKGTEVLSLAVIGLAQGCVRHAVCSDMYYCIASRWDVSFDDPAKKYAPYI